MPDVKQAICILVDALQTDCELRAGFIASIASALKDNQKSEMPFQTEEYVALRVLNRLIGVE